MKRCFNIHAVIDAYEGTNLDWLEKAALKGARHYHTHGLKSKGLLELYTVMKPEFYSDEEIANLINTIADLMLAGEKFDITKKHYIDNGETGEIYYWFYLSPSTSFGEDALRIVLPDKDFNFHYYLLNEDSYVDDIFKIQTTHMIDLLDEKLIND